MSDSINELIRDSRLKGREDSPSDVPVRRNAFKELAKCSADDLVANQEVLLFIVEKAIHDYPEACDLALRLGEVVSPERWETFLNGSKSAFHKERGAASKSKVIMKSFGVNPRLLERLVDHKPDVEFPDSIEKAISDLKGYPNPEPYGRGGFSVPDWVKKMSDKRVASVPTPLPPLERAKQSSMTKYDGPV